MADLDITTDDTFTATKEVLQAKYADATTWAERAMAVVEGNLGNIAGNASGFDVTEFMTAAGAAIAAIPDVGTLDAISFTAPSLRGTIDAIPTATAHTAGAAPNTAVTFTNSTFTDTTLDALRVRLASDITTAHTGLGSAEAALFARETARQNDARTKAYNEITTQFSSRGFDMPPGALLAKQTEMNNESGIRLADSSAQIMAESARLAVDYNKTVISSSTQLVDLLSRVFDSKIMRDFEAAKNTVMMAVETYKAKIQEAVANASLEGVYIKAVGDKDQAVASMFSAESSAQGSFASAQGQRNSAQAAGYEVASRKALGVAELAKSMALSGMDIATRKYLGEIQVMQSAASAASQMVASALNGVSVSTSLGWGASGSIKYDGDLATHNATALAAIAAGLPPASM